MSAFSSLTFSSVTFNTDGLTGHAFSAKTFSSITFDTDGATTGVGAYGSDGVRRRKRIVVRKGGKLLVFSSEAAAANMLADDEPQKVVREAPQDAPKPPVAAEPIEIVPVKAVKQMARAFDQMAEVNRLIRQKQYEALIDLHMRMIEQDEEEVELLLLA
jgi:hypothetical protein